MPIDIHDLNARVAVVETIVKRMEATLSEVAADTKLSRSYQDKQRGVIATLIVVSGVCGAAITKVLSYFMGKAGAA